MTTEKFHYISCDMHLVNHDLCVAILLEHMLKKFEINRTKIKDSCQSGRKVVIHNSKSDLPLVE